MASDKKDRLPYCVGGMDEKKLVTGKRRRLF